MGEAPEDAPPHLHLFLAALFAVVTVAAAADLLLDRPESLLSFHVAAEASLVLLTLGAATWLTWGWYGALKEVRALQSAVSDREAERDAWQEQAGQILLGLGRAIDDQFTAWKLTPTERETALMLLKGYSHKRIARLTGRSERTVRQHGVAVYRKSGLAGRSALAGFFLEDVLLPDPSPLAAPSDPPAAGREAV